MFNKNNAKHKLIYADIVANYKFQEGKTFGEMENDIEAIYRSKVESYGLADQGYFSDDQENRENADQKLNEFFEKKSLQGKM